MVIGGIIALIGIGASLSSRMVFYYGPILVGSYVSVRGLWAWMSDCPYADVDLGGRFVPLLIGAVIVVVIAYFTYG